MIKQPKPIATLHLGVVPSLDFFLLAPSQLSQLWVFCAGSTAVADFSVTVSGNEAQRILI
jgi:hypothetical protein